VTQVEGREIVEAQLLDLYLEVIQDIDTQFQVWISITFAVLVASFVAGQRLSRSARVSIAVLYVFAAIVLYLRYTRALALIPYVLQLFDTYEAPAPNLGSALPIQLRQWLFRLGSGLTVVAVLFPKLGFAGEKVGDEPAEPAVGES
jgi:hypothetical protein